MRWFRDNAWWMLLALTAIGGYVLAVVTRSKDSPSLTEVKNRLTLERNVLKAKAAAAKDVLAIGHEATVTQIQNDHAATIKTLDDVDKAKVEELANDPEALVDFLLRAGS